jgi:hypothetical protein
MDGRARATWLAGAALLGVALAAAHARTQGGVARLESRALSQL